MGIVILMLGACNQNNLYDAYHVPRWHWPHRLAALALSPSSDNEVASSPTPQPAHAEPRPGAQRADERPQTHRWDRDTVLRDLEVRRGEGVADVARQILEWASQRHLDVWFGSGQKDGSFKVGLNDAAGKFFPFALYTHGRVEILFQFMQRRPPFSALELRAELQQRLNAISGVDIPDEAIAKRPGFPVEILTDHRSLHAFLAVMDWSFEQARQQAGA
jgi:hypothetical protein